MIYLNKKIFVIDDVLSEQDCNVLIDIYNARGPTHQWYTFYPMNISKNDETLMCFVEKILVQLKLLISIPISVDWCEVVKWPPNSFMSPHKDTVNERTVFTSITYLNDNYDGGCTYLLNDIVFKPKTGRTVFFDGQYYEHGVSNVTSGLRYTLPIWYKN